MSKPAKQPYMPFYIGDYKKDITVQSLPRHERNIWLDLMCLMWESSEKGYLVLGGKPMTHEAIARTIGEDIQSFEISLTKILTNGCFEVREDGAIFSRRMVRENDLSRIRSLNGSLGGNPNLVKQNSTKRPSKTQANADIDNDIDNENELEILIVEFQTPKISKAIRRWIDHRIKIKKPLDQEALNSLIRLYDGRADELPDDIDHSISNGWKTLNAKSRDRPRATVRKSTKETLNEMMAEALREEQNAEN